MVLGELFSRTYYDRWLFNFFFFRMTIHKKSSSPQANTAREPTINRDGTKEEKKVQVHQASWMNLKRAILLRSLIFFFSAFIASITERKLLSSRFLFHPEPDSPLLASCPCFLCNYLQSRRFSMGSLLRKSVRIISQLFSELRWEICGYQLGNNKKPSQHF